MVQRQKGQVLPIGLALLVLGMLGGYVLFNTGKVATDKMMLANTADAAAYSGTLWQARALNFQSYTNRAMVANQVSIAQAVTLQSWVAYGAVTSENIASVLKPIPIVNAVTEGLKQGMDVVERILSPVTQGLLMLVDTVNQGLSKAQEAMFISTFVATPDVMRAVVTETDPRFSLNTAFSGLGLADNLQQWRSFTDGYSGNDVAAMNERLQMINDSRDDFSRKRNWKFFHFWFMSTPLTRHQVRREGTTQLIRVDTPAGIEWEWKAKDTMSMHNRLYSWKGTKRKELTIGWAEAFANSANSSRTIEPSACTTALQMKSSRCARFLGINRRGEYQADIGMRSLLGKTTRIAMNHYTGVQAYRSLSQSTIREKAPRLRLKVEVSLPTDKTVGSDALGSGDQFAAPINAPGAQLTSISIAEVYYQRPDAQLPAMAGKALEPANGYNPYWASRLSPVSDADRLLAFSLRAGTGSTAKPDSTTDGRPQPTTTPAGTLDSSVAGGPVSSLVSTGAGSTQSTLASFAEPGSSASFQAAAPGSAQFDSHITTGSGAGIGDFDSVVASLDTTRLGQYRKDIEKQLTDALRKQARDMLVNAMTGSVDNPVKSIDQLGAELEQAATEAVGDLTTTEAGRPYTDVIAEATTMARDLEAEFKRIREVIVTDFQVAFEEANSSLELQIAPIREQIRKQRDRLTGSARNEDDSRAVQQRIAALNVEIVLLRDEVKARLARSLIAITHSSTDLYYMTMKEASYLVDEFMAAGEEQIRLPWLEEIEEDDADE